MDWLTYDQMLKCNSFLYIISNTYSRCVNSSSLIFDFSRKEDEKHIKWLTVFEIIPYDSCKTEEKQAPNAYLI